MSNRVELLLKYSCSGKYEGVRQCFEGGAI